MPPEGIPSLRCHPHGILHLKFLRCFGVSIIDNVHPSPQNHDTSLHPSDRAFAAFPRFGCKTYFAFWGYQRIIFSNSDQPRYTNHSSYQSLSNTRLRISKKSNCRGNYFGLRRSGWVSKAFCNSQLYYSLHNFINSQTSFTANSLPAF